MTREEAISLLKGLSRTMIPSDDDNPVIEALGMAIKGLEQEPKTGYWYIDERLESDREVICSNCEQSVFKYHKLDFDYRPKFCPNCGACMKDCRTLDEFIEDSKESEG